MQTEPGKPSNDRVDQVSSLLEQVLEAKLASQSELLMELCADNPDCAVALRQGYGSLQHLDLLQVGQPTLAVAEAAPLAGGLPRTLGPFRLLEFLGAGGMGAVYRAEDEELKRPVALKLVRSELLASARTRSRFQRESEALARLDHPGLCTVYRAGTTDGQPWIAMRLVRGKTLASVLEERRAEQRRSQGRPSSSSRGSGSTREELQASLLVFEKLARALATAHAVGVVHRDIKPANIVLTSDEEPVIIDFGLVHLEDSQSQLTLSGDHIGTPAYMAPEQIAPAGCELGPRTDVYSLGVTLFEVLTLQSPYHPQSREELFHCIVRGERRRLRQARRGLPADMELVLEKALDLEPGRRYASMVEFAEDLRRVRQHEPPAARRIGPALRLRRWCQRNPVATTSVLLLGLGLGTALVLDSRREAARRHSLAMAYGNLAAQLVDENPEHALDMALSGVDLEPDDPESMGLLLRALQEVQPHELWPLPWPEVPEVTVEKLVVAPNGDAALILGDLAGGVDAAPVLWRDGTTVILPIKGGTLDAQWSADGNSFVTTGPDSPPQLWSATGEFISTIVVPDGPANLQIPRARFLLDGEHILFACSDGTARIHDRSKGTWIELAPRLCQQQPGMPGLAVSADGQRIALGDLEGRIVVHATSEALRGQPGRELTTTSPKVFELELGQTGELLHVYSLGDPDCSVWTWEGKPLASWGERTKPAFPVPLDPTQNRVLELAQDRVPQLWRYNGKSLDLQCALAGHDGMVRHGSFGSDGRLLTVGVDGTARVWDANTGRPELVLRAFHHELKKTAFLGATNRCLVVTKDAIHRFDLSGPGGPRLRVGDFADMHVAFPGDASSGAIITADTSQRLTIHDEAGRFVRNVPEPIGRRARMQMSADSRWLVSTSRNRSGETQARIYDQTLSKPKVIPLQMVEPLPIFGEDDQLLLVDAVGDHERGCALYVPTGPGRWQPAADEVQKVFALACAGAEVLAYHAGTATLAMAVPGASATLFRWSSTPPFLRQTQMLLPGKSPAHQLAFAPDGQKLLLACKDRVVRLVDITGNVLTEITGHIGIVIDVAFSPRGDQFLIAATESGVTLHDLDGKRALTIRPRAGAMTIAAYLPDGERLLIGTSARTTRIVPIDPEKLVELARGVRKPLMSPAYKSHYRARVGDTRLGDN